MFPVYDYKYKKLSVGKLLLTKLLENCFNNKLMSFDFTTGNENYKKEWSNDEAILFSFIESYTFFGKIFKSMLIIYKLVTKKFN